MVARRLRALDAPSVTALIHTVGWQQTQSDIDALLTRDESSAIGTFEEAAFEDGDGELLSVAAMQTFHAPSSRDTGYGWLCYVATAPQMRRRGLASALVTTLLSSVPAGSSIGLYGSVDGAPLYERRFAFVDRGHAQLLEFNKAKMSAVHTPTKPAGCSLVPAAKALPEVLALDRECYGVDRAEALSRWAEESFDLC